MKVSGLFILIFALIVLFGCGSPHSNPSQQLSSQPLFDGEAKILQSWHGDYPVAYLDLLTEVQRENPVGFIDDAETFRMVWKAFKPGEAIPEIDFKAHLVLFARNIQFYNRLSIGKVNVEKGVVEILAMETRSARPIENNVAISLVVIAREGITGIQFGGSLVPIPSKSTH